MRALRYILAAGVALGAGLWLANTARFGPPGTDRAPRLIAHRGLHQIEAGAAGPCAAARILPPAHGYLENTLPGIRGAFERGADVVEIDVQRTPSGAFVVFRDSRLGCRTDGSGETRAQPLPYLRGLDIAHGYTADGVTYPFRGQARGMMPTLREVLAADPGGPVLIDIGGDDAADGVALAVLLQEAAAEGAVFGVTGRALPVRAAMAHLPGLRGSDAPGLRACLTRYRATGWTGRVPLKCRDRLVIVSLDQAPWLWGWPHRFTRRMARAGSSVILTGPRDAAGRPTGIDGAAMLARVPEGFEGWILTNRIEVLGPLLMPR